MKVFFVTLALLMVGMVFIAPPLIAIAPMLFVGLLLLASPALLRGGDGGVAVDHDAPRGRSHLRRTTGTTER